MVGILAGVLVTRYAPECTAGFCWGQWPFLLMFVAGGVSGLAVSLRTSSLMLQGLVGVLAGVIVGLSVSFGGGLYAFLGGSTALPRPATPSWMALVPNPLVGLLGGVLGLVGAIIVALVRPRVGQLR